MKSNTVARLLKIVCVLGVVLSGGWFSQPAFAQGLSADGPWIVFLTSTTGNVNVLDQVVAINADGTGSTVLAEGRSYFQLSTSKLGYVAFLGVDTPANGNYYQHLTLTVIQLPSGKVIKELPLTNSDTAVDPKAEAGTDFPSYSIMEVASITVDNVKIASMSWSPDGKTLAYMGGAMGASIDLYTYQPALDEVQWLTSGPTQTVRPVWSPDGKYIVHLGVTGLGTGAGYGVDTMWAAFADDSEKPLAIYSRRTFDGHRSGDELVLGWRDATRFWAGTWTPSTEYAYIRTVNVTTSTTVIIWAESYTGAAADSQTGTLLIAKSLGYYTPEPSRLPGLYLYASDGQIKQLSSEDNFGQVVWSPTMGSYYVEVPKEKRIVAVTPDGTMTELPIPTLPQALKADDLPSLVWLEGTRLTISDQANDGSLGAPRQLATDAYDFVVACPAC